MLPLVTNANIESFLKQSHQKPVIIDAFAEWCGPCQQLSPIIEEVATELQKQYTFLKLDVDAASEVATRFKIRSVPTILFIQNGVVLSTKVGFMNKQTLKSEIEKAFQKPRS
jgi:thioredoxin 1